MSSTLGIVVVLIILMVILIASKKDKDLTRESLNSSFVESPIKAIFVSDNTYKLVNGKDTTVLNKMRFQDNAMKNWNKVKKRFNGNQYVFEEHIKKIHSEYSDIEAPAIILVYPSSGYIQEYRGDFSYIDLVTFLEETIKYYKPDELKPIDRYPLMSFMHNDKYDLAYHMTKPYMRYEGANHMYDTYPYRKYTFPSTEFYNFPSI